MIRFRPVSGATLIGGDPLPNFPLPPASPPRESGSSTQDLRDSISRGRPREKGRISTGALAFSRGSGGRWGTPLTIISDSVPTKQKGRRRAMFCAPTPRPPTPPEGEDQQ